MLGVIVNNRLTATDHVDHLLSSCASLLYALRILRSHGIPSTSPQDVFCATVVAKVTYCAPAWSGTCSAADRARLDSFRCKRLGFADKDLSSVTELFSDADDAFFERIMTNFEHRYNRSYLRNLMSYDLRERTHNRSLITKIHLTERDFLIRMLYKNCYYSHCLYFIVC